MRRARAELALIVALAAGVGLALGLRGTPDPQTAPSQFPAPEPCLAVLEAAAPGPPGPQGRSVEAVAEALEELRGLEFGTLPEPVYVSADELVRRIRDTFEYPARQAEIDARALTQLGAVPRGADLLEEMTTLLGEQVLGYYEPGTGDLVVLAGETDPDGLELLTLVHEMQHALADQALGLPDLDEVDPGRQDEVAAGLALVEGDATITTEAYAAGALTLEDRLSLLLAIPGTGLGDTPYFLARTAAFPYLEGAAFACRLYADGGWAAVDAAYADPPTTTAQILFPDRYGAREPARDPRDPKGPPAPWRAAGAQSVGAADLLFLFEAPGGDPGRALLDPRAAAAGWAGGELRVWTRGADTAVAVALVQRPGERRLCASLAAWYRAAFPRAEVRDGRRAIAMVASGAGQDAVLRCRGREVRVGIGPDLRTARAASR